MKELHTEEKHMVVFVYVFISNPGFMKNWQGEKLT